ncbi:MAG: acylphosphatase [Methanomassiliicoccus sp.]|nr:acylphosphatase [Methanomassiliicoccus sp.]
MQERAEVRFFGKVQGVSFRAYTRRYSIVAGVHGWVQNMADGSVAAVFEGERSDIQRVIHRLCAEHPLAEVERFEVQWSAATGEFDSFAIRP